MPAVNGVLESSIYAQDIDRVARFYEELFGWKPMFSDARLRAYGVATGSVLLVFRAGGSRGEVVTPDGTIPGHDGIPGSHFALAIAAEAWEPWLRHLETCGVAVEKIVRWPRGGQSLYFRDPEDNLVELATPGLWMVY